MHSIKKKFFAEGWAGELSNIYVIVSYVILVIFSSNKSYKLNFVYYVIAFFAQENMFLHFFIREFALFGR